MNRLTALVLVTLVAIPGSLAFAHAPFVEGTDFSAADPFRDPDNDDVEKSRAVYAWLESGDDVDYYRLPSLTAGESLLVSVIVPVCPEYADFLPTYALVGPDLPVPNEPVPFQLPDGYGAMVFPNLLPGEPREEEFEPIGSKFYYEGVTFTGIAETSGEWGVVVWDPYALGGDYVLELGFVESFDANDIARSMIAVPIIRENGELHVACE